MVLRISRHIPAFTLQWSQFPEKTIPGPTIPINTLTSLALAVCWSTWRHCTKTTSSVIKQNCLTSKQLLNFSWVNLADSDTSLHVARSLRSEKRPQRLLRINLLQFLTALLTTIFAGLSLMPSLVLLYIGLFSLFSAHVWGVPRGFLFALQERFDIASKQTVVQNATPRQSG